MKTLYEGKTKNVLTDEAPARSICCVHEAPPGRTAV